MYTNYNGKRTLSYMYTVHAHRATEGMKGAQGGKERGPQQLVETRTLFKIMH